MDRDAFDGLTRLLASSPNRRRTLGTLLVAGLAAALPAVSDAARRKAKVRGNRRGKDRGRRVRTEASCCSTNSCVPGSGKNLGKCCFQDQNLASKNLSGANLGAANFSRAVLSNANLQGANAGNACFVDANLTGARFNGATNLAGAVFCRTIMPNGTLNNGGCSKSTACCETCNVGPGAVCTGAGDVCCAGRICQGGVCVCPPSRPDICNGACVNTDTDPDHCGDCDTACGAGQACCGGECIDTGNDRANCGACGNACAADEICDGGRCRGCNLCAAGCAFATLEAAIAGTPTGGVIRICPGVYPARDVVIAKDLTVVGAGPGSEPTTDTILESNRFQNGLLVEGGVLTLRDLRVTKGHSDLNGGGIVNSANLTLRNVTVIDNTADDNGGGIENLGTLTLAAGTLVTQNRAGFQGGGIYQTSGATIMQAGSRVTGNQTGTGHLLEKGGGIFVESGTVTVANTTIVTDNTPDNCRPTGAVANCID